MNFVRQKIHQTVFYIASILIAITLPFTEYEGIKLNSIAVILLIANWLFEGNLKQKFKLFFSNKLALLFASVYLINIVGLSYTNNFQEGLREVTVKLSLLIMPLVYSTSAKLEEARFKKVLLFFIISIIAVTFYLFKDGFIFAFGNQYNPFSLSNYWLILGRVYCSIYLSLAVFILFLCFFNTEKIFSLGNALVLLCVTYTIYVQGILIVKMTIAAVFLITLLLIFIYLNNIRKRKLIFLLSFTLIASTFYYYEVNNRFRELTNKTFSLQTIKMSEPGINFEISSFSIRHDIWEAALKILKTNSNWLIGVGTGDVPDSLIQTFQQLNFPASTYHDPHNEYFASALRNGILGLLILLAGLFVPLYWSIRQQNYLYISFLLLCVFCMLSESWLSRQSGVVFYAFFNSLFAFHFLKENKKS